MEKEEQEIKTDSEVSPAVKVEQQILEFWNNAGIFQKSLEKTKDNEPYVFYDGPPFATGLPHYGHILASTIKDAVPRYWTMKGRYVRRRWGWDCHGLPIEALVEKKLDISGKKQIEEIGVEKFNEACRSSVLQFAEEWGKTVNRIGRFVEFDNAYMTMDSTYMESVWWALKQIWEKDLIYEGRKVLLYCPRCETPISNFEVASDNSYDDVTEDAVYIKAKLNNNSEETTYVLYWTTTPWTLPGNVALAVGKDIDYVTVKPSVADLEAGIENGQYILEKTKAEILFNNPTILKEYKGSELVGLSYEPPFEVPALKSEQSYKIYAADFVTTEDGTGIVHTAVVYGEEDYELGLKEGLPIVQLLNQQGLFNDQAPEFLRGKFYKKTEEEIVQNLVSGNKLFKKEAYTHSVPFCWRCGTRLYYSALPSWFINIQKVKPRLRELNQQQMNWFPAHLKNGRFDKGLENAPDWNISRNRYWATPLPFWKCTAKNCGRSICIGSVKELAEKALNYDEVYSSHDVTEIDLHRPDIDKIKMECAVCSNEMKRVEEVVDCWVESASMPFAELHYPFENQELFEKQRFPAQFVAEYISQTRAWFYVSHVVSTILFDKAPMENLVTTGVILAEDGQKLSKSKGNFPDPALMIGKYGADSLRYYLLTSPVMQGENLMFSEKELDEVYKKVILLLHNVLSFYKMFAKDSKISESIPQSQAVMDRWILSRLHGLQIEVTKNMDGYNTPAAGRPILKFINELSTWYVRRSRDRIKQSGPDSTQALEVLGHVLVELSKLMAPFTPFIAEYIYKELTGKESVHLADWNSSEAGKPLDTSENELIQKMDIVRSMAELGLSARKESNVKVRQPLGYLAYKIKGEAASILGADLEKILAEELNIKEVSASSELETLPETIMKENNEAAILLSLKIDEELKREGIARELERQVQDMRKKHGLQVGDLIDLYYNTQDSALEEALLEKFDRKKTFVAQIKKELEIETDYEAQIKIEESMLWLGLIRI